MRRFLLRHTDEWVGLVVLVATAAFFVAILQAGVLRDWFRPTSTLRIVLPEAGSAGLSVGGDVEVLGTRAGTVRRIIVNPDQRLYAEAEIDDQAKAFIRRDSEAVIRRRFGIAGAAFVDITRGTGAPLNWEFAVIEATSERAPTENIGALIDEARGMIEPILKDAGRAMKALADTMERIEKGEGNIGRLLVDDTLVTDVEGILAEARGAAVGFARILDNFDATSEEVRKMVSGAGGDGAVQALLRRADAALASLQEALRNVNQAARSAPQIARNVERGTDNLGPLLTQVQQTARELSDLAAQLRGLWLLGGGGAPTTPPARLPAPEVRP